MSYSKGINKTVQVGFITKGPQLTSINDKTNVCELTLVNSYIKTGGEGVEDQESSEFHNVKFYGSLADHVNRVAKKKQKIYIEGRISTESWEVDGEKRYKTVLVADDFQIMAFPKDEASGEQQPS